MPVSPHAAPDEHGSPYFKANEKICKSFDDFIVSIGGETRGIYNAFSYNVLGKVKHPNKWEFRIKKSSFSNGGLWLSSEYQNLHVASIWNAENVKSDCPNFYIRRKKWIDYLINGFSKNRNWLNNERRYIIKSQNPGHELLIDLKNTLDLLIAQRRIWEIEYNDSSLRIELRSEETHTSVISNLLEKNYV